MREAGAPRNREPISVGSEISVGLVPSRAKIQKASPHAKEMLGIVCIFLNAQSKPCNQVQTLFPNISAIQSETGYIPLETLLQTGFPKIFSGSLL